MMVNKLKIGLVCLLTLIISGLAGVKSFAQTFLAQDIVQPNDQIPQRTCYLTVPPEKLTPPDVIKLQMDLDLLEELYKNGKITQNPYETRKNSLEKKLKKLKNESKENQ